MSRILLILALLSAQTAVAQESRRYAYSLHWENDVFAIKDKTDRWYTNGLRFSWTNDVREDQELKEEQRYKHPLNFLTNYFCRAGCTGRGWAFGQNFYTPSDITIANPQPNDRPWAAWTYYGIHAQRGDDQQATTYEVDIGVIGPVAQGEVVQREWHRLIKSSRMPEGWDNQLKNEPAFVATWQRRTKWGGRSFDVVYHYGGHAGTVMLAGFVGATVRLGKNISGVGIPGIRPTMDVPLVSGASVSPQSVNGDKSEPDFAFSGRSRELQEWYVFAFAEVRAVAYNIFLDGNFFRNTPHSVDKKYFVPDIGAGVTWRWAHNKRISYVLTRRGQEFDAPSFAGPKAQTFAALVFAKELN